MIEVKIGVNNGYKNGEYELIWLCGEDYLKDNDYSAIAVYKDVTCVDSVMIYNNQDLEKANNKIQQYGFKLKKEEDMTEVKIGVNKKYSNGKYELIWKDGKDYLKYGNYSAVIILKDGVRVFDLGMFSLDNLKPYNKMLKEYGFKLVDNNITITSDAGEKISISKDKAEELGFDIS